MPEFTRWTIALCMALGFGALGCEPPDPPPADPDLVEAYSESVVAAESLSHAAREDEHEHADSLLPRRIALPTLPTLTGDSLRQSDLAGSVVLLNYWATWCAPCREEMPDLVALHTAYESQGFEVIGISLDTDEPAFVSAFADQMEVPYRIALDPGGEAAAAAGGVYGLPTSILLNRDGSVAWRANGLITREEAEPLIEATLDDG